jgi:hypothetical protein
MPAPAPKLLSESWKPAPEEGVTVFLQGLEKRGPHNRRKRIYMTALTPDLYRPMYGDKVVQFFDKLLDDGNAGKPLMRAYLESYFDLYWDLDLGVKPTRSLNGSTTSDKRSTRSSPIAIPPRRSSTRTT